MDDYEARYFAAAVRDTETALDLLFESAGYLAVDDSSLDILTLKIDELRVQLKAAARKKCGGIQPIYDALEDHVHGQSSLLGYALKEEPQ